MTISDKEFEKVLEITKTCALLQGEVEALRKTNKQLMELIRLIICKPNTAAPDTAPSTE